MFRKTILASSLSLLLASHGAWGLGLGGMRPASALNQPFSGEIELVGVNPDELDAVKVSLAPEAEFTKRGVDRQHYLTRLRFKPQVSAQGKTVIRVTTVEPIREPYMDFLVEVKWPKGRMVKGFTILLDPPVTSRGATPSVTPAVASTRPAVQPGPVARADPAPTSRPALPTARSKGEPVSPRAGVNGFPLSSGPIRAGAGLWRTARALSPSGATVAQTAMALYRNNQDAFVRGNINVLRQGAVLQIPSSAELFALDADAAEREFQAALSGKKVTAKPLTDVTAAVPDQGSRLRIAGTAQATEGREGPAADGSAPEAGATVTPELEQELLLLRETSESTQQGTEELRARVRQLETHLSDIQALLTLRDAELARLQQAAEEASTTPSDAEPSDAATAQPAPGEERRAVPQAGTSPAVAGVPAVPGSAPTGDPADLGQTGTGSAVELVAKPLADVPQDEPGSTVPLPGASGPADGARTSPTADVIAEPIKTAGAVGKGEVAEPAGGGVGESWVGGLPLVGGTLDALPTPAQWALALGVPLLGVLGWLSVRRRRRTDENVSDFDLPDAPGALGEATALASAKFESSEVFQQPEPDQPSVSEGTAIEDQDLWVPEDEPDESEMLSEADIYIAYGRYPDAEALLKQGIDQSPTRADLRYKLADVYVGAKNPEALSALMEEMDAAGMDQERPEEWSRLVASAKEVRAEAAGIASVVAAGVGGNAAATPVGWDRSASQVDQGGAEGVASAQPRDVYTELYIPGPMSDETVTPPSDAEGLVSDDPRNSGFEFELDDPDAGPLSLYDDTPADRITETDSAPRSSHADGSDFDLTISDLTLYGDTELNELGFPEVSQKEPVSPPLSESSWPDGFDLEPQTDFAEPEQEAYDRISALDGEALEAPTGAGDASADLGQRGASPEPSPVSPDSGIGTAKSALGPTDQDDIPSEQLFTQWQMEGGAWDEVATKLDLGRAYVEMSDRPAAQAILLEVLEEGTPEQQVEAKKLLSLLRGE